MENYAAEFLKSLHKKCNANENILKKSKMCGCFYCLEIFNPDEITFWLNDKNCKTALCPYCTIDSVIPESDCGEYELNIELLENMKKYWF